MKKKLYIFLKVFLGIVGVLLLALITFILLYTISEKQERVWASGIVIIDGTEIRLPCTVSAFESTYHTKILYEQYNGKINSAYSDDLGIQIHTRNDMVKGITVDKYDPVNIAFPGGITMSSSIEEIRETYDTKPLNVFYRYFSEPLIWSEEISSSYWYNDSEYLIEFHTKPKKETIYVNGEAVVVELEEIESVFYCFLEENLR